MNYFALAILTVIGAMCIFVISDRICNCIEHCAYCRAFGKYIEKTGKVDMFDFKKSFSNSKTEVQEN